MKRRKEYDRHILKYFFFWIKPKWFYTENIYHYYIWVQFMNFFVDDDDENTDCNFLILHWSISIELLIRSLYKAIIWCTEMHESCTGSQ